MFVRKVFSVARDYKSVTFYNRPKSLNPKNGIYYSKKD